MHIAMDRTRRVASDERILWGHKFTWTPEHSSMAELRPLLYSYDKLATDALDVLDEISPPPTTPATGCPMSQRDLYALVEEHAEVDETLGKLWREVTTVPDWVDWEQLARGQAIVHQYSGQILLGVSATLFFSLSSPDFLLCSFLPCSRLSFPFPFPFP
jgi:hypothetical protein